MQKVFKSNEFEESRICLEMLIDDILLDLCFEVHWKARTGLCERPSLPIEQAPPTLVAQPVIACSLCNSQVSGYRYAQHLEKCLNGTKRAGTRRKQNVPPPVIETDQAPSSIPPGRKKPRYYGSLTVRIKLKNGVPVRNQRRKTVPSLVFLSHSTNGLSARSPLLLDEDDESNGAEGSVDSTV